MRDASHALDRDSARRAFDQIARLKAHIPDAYYERSPVKVLNTMSGSDEAIYCPLVYGYSTYSMRGYAQNALAFGDIQLSDDRPPVGAVLGGAGIGVLKSSKQPEAAAAFAAWLTSDLVQSTLYVQFGGQAAARAAWLDNAADRIAGGFYSATRSSMDLAYVRPNVPGFHDFQARSGLALQACLQDGGAINAVLNGIDQDWTRTLAGSTEVRHA